MIYYIAATNPFDFATVYVQRVDEDDQAFICFEPNEVRYGTLPEFFTWCKQRDGKADFNGSCVIFEPGDMLVDFETKVTWT